MQHSSPTLPFALPLKKKEKDTRTPLLQGMVGSKKNGFLFFPLGQVLYFAHKREYLPLEFFTTIPSPRE